jgi:hypothetical protein
MSPSGLQGRTPQLAGNSSLLLRPWSRRVAAAAWMRSKSSVFVGPDELPIGLVSFNFRAAWKDYNPQRILRGLPTTVHQQIRKRYGFEVSTPH